jgi:hypothetical protein
MISEVLLRDLLAPLVWLVVKQNIMATVSVVKQNKLSKRFSGEF